MSLMNFRLTAEEKKIAAELRAAGVNMSDLFRNAMKEEHRKRCMGRKPRRTAREIIEELDRKYPIPADAVRHGIDTTDRHAVSTYIRTRLKSKRGA